MAEVKVDIGYTCIVFDQESVISLWKARVGAPLMGKKQGQRSVIDDTPTDVELKRFAPNVGKSVTCKVKGWLADKDMQLLVLQVPAQLRPTRGSRIQHLVVASRPGANLLRSHNLVKNAKGSYQMPQSSIALTGRVGYYDKISGQYMFETGPITGETEAMKKASMARRVAAMYMMRKASDNEVLQEPGEDVLERIEGITDDEGDSQEEKMKLAILRAFEPLMSKNPGSDKEEYYKVGCDEEGFEVEAYKRHVGPIHIPTVVGKMRWRQLRTDPVRMARIKKNKRKWLKKTKHLRRYASLIDTLAGAIQQMIDAEMGADKTAGVSTTRRRRNNRRLVHLHTTRKNRHNRMLRRHGGGSTTI